MPTASPLAAFWTVRHLSPDRVLVERVIGGVDVRVELFSGGGFVASHVVVRVAGRVVAIRKASGG